MLYTNHPFLLFFKFILYRSLSNQEKYEINGWKIGEHPVYDILTSNCKVVASFGPNYLVGDISSFITQLGQLAVAVCLPGQVILMIDTLL